MIVGSMRLFSNVRGLTFSHCYCFASTRAPLYRSGLVRKCFGLRNSHNIQLPAACQQLRTFPSSCPRQPGGPQSGHSCQPCCSFSSGGPQPRRRTAHSPADRPRWPPPTAPRPSLPARQPLPARHAARPSHGGAGAHRRSTQNTVRSGAATVRDRARGGQQAVATDWALDWENERREKSAPLVAQPKQAQDPAPAEAAPDGERPAVRILDALSEEAISNTTDMQLVFLGTSGRQPTQARAAPAVALRKGKSNWLFDCGEDTQRQLLKQALVRPGKIDRIFVTRAAGEAVFGLPGMICTCSTAREMGLNTSDLPMHIYGPPGLAEYIRTFLTLSDTYVVMPIVVHEFVDCPVPEQELEWPQELEKRCCLFRQRIPPDQLNPRGHFDGGMVQLTQRHQQRQRRRKAADLRAIVMQQRLPEPGDPARTDVQPAKMTWTIRCDDAYTVTVGRVGEGSGASFGYVVCESDKVGSLNVAACEDLGVKAGRDYARLKSGQIVQSVTGDTVHPEQVLGKMIMGRSIAVLGQQPPAGYATPAWLAGCDLLVQPVAACPLPAAGSADAGGAGQYRGAARAGAVASSAAAKHLVLTGFPGVAAALEHPADLDMPCSSDQAGRPEGQRQAAGAGTLEAADPSGSNLGQRHVNAAVGRLRSGFSRDRFAEQCMDAARAAYGRADVTAAQDLMVVSVERL